MRTVIWQPFNSQPCSHLTGHQIMPGMSCMYAGYSTFKSDAMQSLITNFSKHHWSFVTVKSTASN